MTEPQKAAHVELAEALETVTKTLARVTAERDRYKQERDEAVSLGLTTCEIGVALGLRLAEVENERDRALAERDNARGLLALLNKREML